MDMEKAFDRMEYGYLLSIMEKLGFSSIWIAWIRACISSASFSILLNDSPYGYISPKRGLKQGDHLSPFLFILGSEVFSRLMFKEEKVGFIKGLKISINNFALTSTTCCLLMTCLSLVELTFLKLVALIHALRSIVNGLVKPSILPNLLLGLAKTPTPQPSLPSFLYFLTHPTPLNQCILVSLF